MVLVGMAGIIYNVPTGLEDAAWLAKPGVARVPGGYQIAETETTYELWYAVRTWAEDNGYQFQNAGMQGSKLKEFIGATPTPPEGQPVTTVSWRDCVVWLNALSEMKGLQPVYRTAGEVVRDSRDSNGKLVDKVEQTDNNGYRLPTKEEWEMAARWIDGTNWTPGSCPSGIIKISHNTLENKKQVAWFLQNSANKPQPVSMLQPNSLGIYDLSGNVSEWCYDWYSTSSTPGTNRPTRGGCFTTATNHIGVYKVIDQHVQWAISILGFRIARTL